jgi:hypothetical protein
MPNGPTQIVIFDAALSLVGLFASRSGQGEIDGVNRGAFRILGGHGRRMGRVSRPRMPCRSVNSG